MMDLSANQQAWLIVSVVILGVWVPACVVVAKLVGTIRDMSGGSLRANERQQQQQQAMVERLVEKLSSADPKIWDMHTRERRQEAYNQAAVEREAIHTQEAAKVQPVNQEVSPGSAMY
jgi:hypothetical protein